MNDYLLIINSIATLLIIPGLVILGGIKVELAKLTILLSSHHDRLSRLETNRDRK
jgi:hypothetical protein